MEIIGGELKRNEVNANAAGGTEMMVNGLFGRIDNDLLKEFQIVASRVRSELDPSKIRIFWAHDLPGDPESQHLANGGWTKWHHIIFVSNWQMQRYIEMYRIPWSRCIVLRNAIEPLEMTKGVDEDGKVRIVYHSTPHRGLDILYDAYSAYYEKDQNVHLDVFSSYALYGWTARDEKFKELFEKLDGHPGITRHPTLPNEEMRRRVSEAHVFAYPSTWPETSCLCLMEAMSAGLICVHPNFGGLYETAMDWTMQYQYQDQPRDHTSVFANILGVATERARKRPEEFQSLQKATADYTFGWDRRALEWTQLLQASLTAGMSRDIPQPREMFTYRMG